MIETRQLEIAERNGITLTNHSLYLYGECQDKEQCKAFSDNS
jgi:Fur family ferric uptake transcriptional regulator